MLKQKYFLTDFFILSAEKQPIKSLWRKIEWLRIFLGFDFPVSDCERRLNNIEFRKKMKQKVEDAINEKIPQINKQLKKEQFIGYNFYFYIVPFYELDKIRKQIIADLKLENI